ncbi:Prostaglandin E synthase 3 (Cytosolic) [Coemansia sp. RSA 2681]|nr:Prostaglandin E synthase 3 (Cytosolic) [Coemansia sp. RSA 2681]
MLPPTVLWAQRKDVVYLTIEVDNAPEATITENSIDFECVKEDRTYKLHLDFFEPIVPKESLKLSTKRVSVYCLKKADDKVWWKRLYKQDVKFHYVHTDFSRYVDEDESEDESSAHPDTGFSQLGMGGGMPGGMDFSQFGMGGMGGMGGGMGDMPDFSALEKDTELNGEESGEDGSGDEEDRD